VQLAKRLEEETAKLTEYQSAVNEASSLGDPESLQVCNARLGAQLAVVGPLLEEMSKHQLKETEVISSMEATQEELREELQTVKQLKFLAYLGCASSLFGFVLWYVQAQRYQDQTTILQRDKTRIEVEAAALALEAAKVKAKAEQRAMRTEQVRPTVRPAMSAPMLVPSAPLSPDAPNAPP
jgi:hypothetical protein